VKSPIFRAGSCYGQNPVSPALAEAAESSRRDLNRAKNPAEYQSLSASTTLNLGAFTVGTVKTFFRCGSAALVGS